MKFLSILLLIFLTGCNQFKSPIQPNSSEYNRKILGSQTQNVIENLKQKPEWLFTGDACPVEVMPEFEEKIKLKAIGCADDPDSCLEKCEANDANSCYALGLLLDEQRGKDGEDIVALHLRACKLGIVSGCTNYAVGRSNLFPENENIAKCAAETFEKTCARNDSWGCSMYGLILGNGVGVEKDLDKAVETLKKSCAISGGNSEACQSSRKTEELIYKMKDKEKDKQKSNVARHEQK